MFNVLLVDDEIASIKYLRNLISSYSPAFKIVAECENGHDALAVLKQQAVDLLITDVKMPIMDGVALAKEARCLYPEMHILIVSGYAEFEYAKGAIEVAAEEYLLKPLSIDQARNVLQAVEEKLRDKRAEEKKLALRSLVSTDKADIHEIQKRLGDISLFAAIVRFGNLSPLRVGKHEHFQVSGAIEDVPENVWVLQGRDEAEFIIFVEKQPINIEQILSATKGRVDCDTYTMVIQNDCCPPKDIHTCVEELTRYLDAKLVMGKTTIYRVPPYEKTPYVNFTKSELLKLDFAMASGNNQRIKETLLAWADFWDEQEMPQRWIEWAVAIVVQRFLELPHYKEINHLQIFDEINELYALVNSANELMLGVWDIAFEPHSQAKQKRQESQAMYEQILRFIADNYPERLTIDGVCSVFGISQTYLSRLFRKYGQTTFTEHLTKCRISTAKRLIAEDPDLKLSDVALLVGYDSSSYFGKVFRNYVGMTPSQYASEQRDKQKC